MQWLKCLYRIVAISKTTFHWQKHFQFRFKFHWTLFVSARLGTEQTTTHLTDQWGFSPVTYFFLSHWSSMNCYFKCGALYIIYICIILYEGYRYTPGMVATKLNVSIPLFIHFFQNYLNSNYLSSLSYFSNFATAYLTPANMNAV